MEKHVYHFIKTAGVLYIFKNLINKYRFWVVCVLHEVLLSVFVSYQSIPSIDKDKQEKQRIKILWANIWKIKNIEVMSGIIAGKKLLHKYQLISFWYGPSCLLLSEPSFVQVFASALWASLDGAVRDWRRTDGGEGLLLKGIITVSPEYVYNHSAKQWG